MKTTNILIIIVIVLLVLSTGGTYYLLSNSGSNLSKDEIKSLVKEAVLDIEYTKVGGKDNFKKINKLQIAQINKALGQNNKPTVNQPTVNNKPNGNIISQTQIKEVKKGTYVLGNPDAEISFIEYSDLECPFCKKLHQAGTIDQVLKQYDGKVNFIFKQFPLYFHQNAQKEAEAAECIGELGGKDKYYKYINTVFKRTTSNGTGVPITSLKSLAIELGVDGDKFESCLNSGKYTQKVKNQEKEGANVFKVTGTPGNVILNNKTGKWVILPGAYPYGAFKSKIDNLLNK